jgi:hypothetical protein
MDAPRQRLSDTDARARACHHLEARYGIPASRLVRWDPTHPLQGHLVLRGAELVVIAPRTSDHAPVLLSDEEWNACSRSAAERDRLLAA